MVGHLLLAVEECTQRIDFADLQQSPPESGGMIVNVHILIPLRHLTVTSPPLADAWQWTGAGGHASCVLVIGNGSILSGSGSVWQKYLSLVYDGDRQTPSELLNLLREE